MSAPLLEVERLCVRLPVGPPALLRRRRVELRAVEDVSFHIEAGEALGLVGESGSGKSTIARTIVGLQQASSGSIRLRGQELVGLSRRARFPLRRDMQIVFQDALDSLDPRRRVAEIVAEPLAIHHVARGGARRARVLELLEAVGLGSEHLARRPHELSGGQRQRVGIARALALEPALLICDEPVSALDVSIQGQILNLLAELKQRLELAILFIAHDLFAVRSLCERVAVLYLGRLVELAGRERLFSDARHPYTRALIESAPRLTTDGAEASRAAPAVGEIPSPLAPPPGCPFHPRCPEHRSRGLERCTRELPALLPAERGESVACHLAEPGGQRA